MNFYGTWSFAIHFYGKNQLQFIFIIEYFYNASL